MFLSLFLSFPFPLSKNRQTISFKKINKMSSRHSQCQLSWQVTWEEFSGPGPRPCRRTDSSKAQPPYFEVPTGCGGVQLSWRRSAVGAGLISGLCRTLTSDGLSWKQHVAGRERRQLCVGGWALAPSKTTRPGLVKGERGGESGTETFRATDFAELGSI